MKQDRENKYRTALYTELSYNTFVRQLDKEEIIFSNK